MEKTSNKELLENIAKNVLNAKSEEEITSFVSTVLYGILICN